MILNDSELELEVSKQHKVKTENPEQIILEDNFKAALNNFCGDYFEEEKEYIDFFKKYGTHFIAEATLGGKLMQKRKINSNYKTSQKEQQTTVGGSVAPAGGIGKAIGASFEMKTASQQSDEKFEKGAKNKIQAYGGHPFVPGSKNLTEAIDEWVSSIPKKIGTYKGSTCSYELSHQR